MARSNTVELIARLKDQLSGPLGQAKSRLKKFGDTAKRVATGVGILATAVFAAAKKLADFGAAIQDMSDFSGIGVESLQGLIYGIEQAGGSAQNLSMAFRTQARFMGYLEQGTATYTQYLDDLNLTYEQLKGLSPEETFLTLTDALAGVQDEVKRTEIGMVLFGGRGMSSILSAMEQFDGSLRNAQDQFEDLGHALSEDQITDLKKFKDAMTDLQYRFRGFLADSIVPLLPKLDDFADGIMDAAETAIPALVTAVETALPVFNTLIDIAGLAAKGWEKLSGADFRDAVDASADALGNLATALESQVAAGMMTATEAGIIFQRELDHYIEATTSSAMEAEVLRGKMIDLGVGFDIARRALNELMGSVFMTDQLDRVAGSVQAAGENILGMIVNVEALNAAIDELSTVPPPGSGIDQDMEEYKEFTEFRKQLDLAMLEALRAKRQQDLEEQRSNYEAMLEARQSKEEEIEDWHRQREEDRLARIQAVNDALLSGVRSGFDSLSQGLTTLAVEGKDAARQWGDAWIAEFQRMILDAAFKTLFNLLTGGGGIFSLLGFQEGGEILHAQGGLKIKDSGPYGDRHLVAVERGEEVVRRRPMTDQTIPSTSVNLSLVYSPVLSTASPGEAIRLASEVGRILQRGGYI